jgi:pseudouridine kinase
LDKRIGPFSSITVFGGATVDRIAMTAGPAVLGASNPGTSRSAAGGVGLNVARNLARLGHSVRLVTRIGADAEGAAILAAAEAARVDMSAADVSETSSTASYQAAFDNAGGLVIGIADMAIAEEMTPATLGPAAARSPAGDLWVIDANLPAATIVFLAGEAQTAGRALAALAVSPVKALRLAAVLDRVTLLFANRAEAAALLGRVADEDQRTAAKLALGLAGKGLRHAVISDSAGPLAGASGGVVRAFTPLPAAVRSVNGAGDALAAGTIHGLALGQSLFEAVELGLAAAAITVESEATVTELTRDGLAVRIGGSIRRVTS